MSWQSGQRRGESMRPSFVDNPFLIVGPIVKSLARQKLAVFVSLLISLIMAMGAHQLTQNQFQAGATAIFDRSDLNASAYGISDQADFLLVSRLFIESFQNVDFQVRLGQAIGGINATKTKRPIARLFPESYRWLRHQVRKTKAKIYGPPQEESPESYFRRYFSDKLFPEAEAETGLLRLTVVAATPELAQKIANAGIELFIRSELARQYEHLAQKVENLKKLESLRDRKAAATRQQYQTQSELLALEDRERTLNDQLTQMRTQTEATRLRLETQKATREAELMALEVNLAANHPQVRAKREEIASLERELASVRSQQQTATGRMRAAQQTLRQKMLAPQIKQAQLGQNGGLPGAFSQLGEDYVQFYSAKVQNIEVDMKLLAEQLKDAKKRTKIKQLTWASLTPEPTRNLQLRAAGFVFTLSVGFFLSLIVLRELTNPMVSANWKLAHYINKPVILEVSKSLDTKNLDAERALLLGEPKSPLARHRPGDTIALSPLQASKTVMLIDCCQSDASSTAVQSIISSSDIDYGRTLLVDLNNRDPMFYLTSEEKKELGERRVHHIDDLLLPNKNETGIDYILLPYKLQSKATRSSVVRSLQRSHGQLAQRYDHIFLRGFPSEFFSENLELSDLSDDMIMIVDTETTTFAELKGAVESFDEAKVKGLALVRA